jgi:hypothetical protein
MLDKMKSGAGTFTEFIISEIEGRLQNEKKCLECGLISTVTEAFIDMSLAISTER